MRSFKKASPTRLRKTKQAKDAVQMTVKPARPKLSVTDDDALSATTEWTDRLRAALEYIDEGFTIIDENLMLRAWNKRVETLLGFPEGTITEGTSLRDLIYFNAERGEYGPGDPEELTQERMELARQFEQHRLVRERPDGTILEVRGTPVPNIGFVTIYKDITEQIRAEQALKESVDTLEARVEERTQELKEALENLKQSEQWLRMIADAVPVLIGYVDSTKTYRFANRMYEEWFGFTNEQVIGSKVWDVLGGELYPGHENDLNAVLSGKSVASDFNLETPDGRSIINELTYLPHFGEGGEIQGYFVLGQDVTERRQTDVILRQVQKMEAVGQLTGGIAHDFNNLLTIIIGNLALLEDREDLDESVADATDAALSSARRGAGLVKRLLAFSRQKALHSDVYDPKRTIAGMSDLLQRTLGSSIEVEIRLDGENWNITSDPNELESAVLNLAINSRDAMPDGGHLLVTVKGQHVGRNAHKVPPGDYVLISVADNGCGMPFEVAERAFEPFFTSKKMSQGSGLGLSMVYGFARRSGGYAAIDSREGDGTVIILYLPRHMDPKESVKKKDKSRIQDMPRGSENILLVEDETEVRAYVRRILIGLGYSILEAANTQEAIAVLESGKDIDLVLTDVEMPGGTNGIDLVREVRNRWPGTKTLVMSGYPDKALGRDDVYLSESDLLSKPFEKAELAQYVRNAIDRIG